GHESGRFDAPSRSVWRATDVHSIARCDTAWSQASQARAASSQLSTALAPATADFRRPFSTTCADLSLPFWFWPGQNRFAWPRTPSFPCSSPPPSPSPLLKLLRERKRRCHPHV